MSENKKGAPAVWKCAPHRGRVVRARVFTIINAAHEQKRGKMRFCVN